MRRKRVWRYYCEFCGKSKGTKQSMELHEKHCTANPDRECRLCEGGGVKSILALLPPYDDIKIHYSGSNFILPEETVKEIREVSDHCPICLFAAIRQWSGDGSSHDYFPGFEYEKEVKVYLADVREMRAEEAREAIGYCECLPE